MKVILKRLGEIEYWSPPGDNLKMFKFFDGRIVELVRVSDIIGELGSYIKDDNYDYLWLDDIYGIRHGKRCGWVIHPDWIEVNCDDLFGDIEKEFEI